MAEDEMFKVLKSGKRMKKSWKRMITKVTFVGAVSPEGEGDHPVCRDQRTFPVTPLMRAFYSLLILHPLTSQGFTRKPPKYERFIRPTGLRMTKAHVTHPELKATFCLDIIGIKKNPNGQVWQGGYVWGSIKGGGGVASQSGLGPTGDLSGAN